MQKLFVILLHFGIYFKSKGIVMTDLILEIIDSYSEKYEFSLVPFDGGKGANLVKNKRIVARIFDNDFGLNPSSVACLVNDRVELLRTLAENGIPCTEIFVLKADSPKSVQLKLSNLIQSEGEFNICVSGAKKGKIIDSESSLIDFLEKQEYPTTFDISAKSDRIGGYSVLINHGMVASVFCFRSLCVIGDGESALWELLSTERITEYNNNLDLNKIPKANERVYIGDPARNVGMTLEEVTDFRIVSDIAKLVNYANSKVGINFGMVNVYYKQGEYYIDGATTKVDLTGFAKSNNQNLIKTCNMIENVLKELL